LQRAIYSSNILKYQHRDFNSRLSWTAVPINILNQIKSCPEVCQIYCATANPLQVIVASTLQGWGILGVIDGYPPKGVESDEDREERRDLLRRIGYKR